MAMPKEQALSKKTEKKEKMKKRSGDKRRNKKHKKPAHAEGLWTGESRGRPAARPEPA